MFLEVLVVSFEVLDLPGKPHGLGLCAGPSLNYHRLTHFASPPCPVVANRPSLQVVHWHL